MNRDQDEFSNLQPYKPRQTYKKAYRKSKHNRNHSHINSHSDYEDYDSDEEDEENNDKYCCDCLCCKCPWPIPSGVWCVKDACGLVCVTITWLLVLYAEFVVMFVIILPAPFTITNFLNTIIFHALAFLALSSHSMAMITDPG
jgi:hypothetical protein